MLPQNQDYSLRIAEENGMKVYYITFLSGQDKGKEERINEAIYLLMDSERKLIQNQTRSDERHKEFSDLSDLEINMKAREKDKTDVFKQVFQIMLKKDIEDILSTLTKNQSRRIRLKFFDGKSGETIAQEEGVTKSAVSESINTGLEKFKEEFLRRGLER